MTLLTLASVYTVITKTISLKYGPASKVTIIGYLSIIMILFIDVVFFGTEFTPL
jgi:drug/metabolite transporter (DMT)-like permease